MSRKAPTTSRSVSGRSAAVLAMAFSLLLTGCLTRKIIVPQSQRPLPAQTRNFTDLIQDLKERSRAIRTLSASVLFAPSGGARKKGELTELRVHPTGVLLVNRPDDIRIQLKMPILGTSAADMVSDGLKYFLWVPWTNKFYDGYANEAIQVPNLDFELPAPRDIARAIFVDITPFLDNPQKYRLVPRQATAGQHSYYIVEVIDIEKPGIGETQEVEEIWIDRTSMEIVRQQMFGKEGRLETDTEFSGYQMAGEVPFPRVITIQRPVEDVTLKMTFEAAPRLNVDLPSEDFQLEPQPGVEFVHVRSRNVNPEDRR